MQAGKLSEVRVMLNLAGISRREAAEFLSLSCSALNHKLNGRRTLTRQEEELLRKKAQEKMSRV